MNDTQETDIEIRTGDPDHIHFTNQQTRPGNGETTYAVPAPATMSSAFHEYRYDWLPTGTNFYIDGVLVMSINRNVPSAAGWLMWNSWSNAWAWTFGPPAQDNILLIRSVEAYFNRTSVDTSNCTACSDSSAATGVVVTSAGAHVTKNAAIGNPPSSTSPTTSTSSTTSTLASSPVSSPASSLVSSSATTSSTRTETPSQADDGTSNFAIPTCLSARLSTEDTETSAPTMFDDTRTNNTLQTTITTGIVFDSTEILYADTNPSPASAAYTRHSIQQLLRMYNTARLIVADSI